jgi:hypothetical protein
MRILLLYLFVVDELDDCVREDCSTVVPTTAVPPATWLSPEDLASVRITVVDVEVKRRLASSAPKLNFILKIFIFYQKTQSYAATC